MDGIEIIQAEIPLDNYEKKITNLINSLVAIDELLFQDKSNQPKQP